jgi:hypothetical protein
VALKKVVSWLLAGVLVTGLFLGCETTKKVEVRPSIPAAPSPLRPLTGDIISNIADPATVQYYISSWVILNYEDIPPYPNPLPVGPVQNVTPELSTSPLRSGIDVNLDGTVNFRYGTDKSRIILIDEQTPGILLGPLNGANGSRVLAVCFESGNDRTLVFKEDPSGLFFFLDPPNSGGIITYGDDIYKQWMHGTPFLLIRMQEKIDETIRSNMVRGRRVQSPSVEGSSGGGGGSGPTGP